MLSPINATQLQQDVNQHLNTYKTTINSDGEAIKNTQEKTKAIINKAMYEEK